MADNPYVSILMPVYNGELYISEAIESILSQTYPNFELVIIDDGSTDNTAEILGKYQLKDNRIRLFRHAENQGVVPTLNQGLQLIRGVYLARMDADDVSMPERLALQIQALDNDPDLIIIGSAYELIGPQGEHQRIDRLPTDDTSIRWHMLFHSSFANSSVMVRAEILRRYNLTYNSELVPAEDYDVWSRVINYGKGANFPQPLVQYRQHPAQVTKIHPTNLRESGDKISQCNLYAKMGITCSLNDVKILRSWYQRFPDRINQADLKLCQILIDTAFSFSLKPGQDTKTVSSIKCRIVLHILKSTPLHLWSNLLSVGLFKLVRPTDIPMFPKLIARNFLNTLGKPL